MKQTEVTRVISAWSTGDGFYLVGPHNSQKVHELRSFLVRNGVPFRWVDLDTDPLVGLLSSGSLPTSVRWPVCLFPDGSSLEDPSLLDLARKVGLHTHPDLPEYDLAIVGAGPAGLTAAVYAASEGLRTVVIEREAPGGQAGTSSMIENYPGFPQGVSGTELTELALEQARRFGAEFILVNQIMGYRADDVLVHYLQDGSELACHAEIIATGVSYRRLEVPGVRELTGKGVYYGSALTEAPLYRGKQVFVVGGGNSSGQLALHLAKFARSVTLLVRGEALDQNMSRYLIDQLGGADTIDMWFRTQVVRVEGDRFLETLLIDREGTEMKVNADALFILIGQRPATDWAERFLARDEKGLLLTGQSLPREGALCWCLPRDPLSLETSTPGVFAAGDVRHGSINRVAWAVGEGAMAVQQAHQYLGKLMAADLEYLAKTRDHPPARIDINMSDAA